MNVPKGSTIVVYISKGPQPVKVTFDYGDGSRSTTETKYYEKPYGSLPTPTETVIPSPDGICRGLIPGDNKQRYRQ